ncbi:MAG: class I SAM-dependent methyltransferase [Hyphomicrobiales bacterium]
MPLIKRENDAMGAAINSYYQNKDSNMVIDVHSDICEKDVIPVSYLFRDYDDMPEIEKKALQLSKGHILDVGAGSGCHSLFLQNASKDVTAIDVSPYSVDVMKSRGVAKAWNTDFYDIQNEKYDTLLFLMNGIGICGTLSQLPLFLEKCKRILNDGGQILLDSSDLSYMYEGEDDIYKPDHYLGEVSYVMGYDDYTSDRFDWLYIDYPLLRAEAEKAGFICRKILDGEHCDYLAQLQLGKDD